MSNNNNVGSANTSMQSKPPPVDYDSWCRTKGGEEVKFKFVWTIERFSERPEETAKVNPIIST